MKALLPTKITPVPQGHFAQKQPEELYHAHLEHTEKKMVQLLRMIVAYALLDFTVPTKMEPLLKFSALKGFSVPLDHRTNHCVQQDFIATELKQFTHATLDIIAHLAQHIPIYAKKVITALQGKRRKHVGTN